MSTLPQRLKETVSCRGTSSTAGRSASSRAISRGNVGRKTKRAVAVCRYDSWRELTLVVHKWKVRLSMQHLNYFPQARWMGPHNAGALGLPRPSCLYIACIRPTSLFACSDDSRSLESLRRHLRANYLLATMVLHIFENPHNRGGLISEDKSMWCILQLSQLERGGESWANPYPRRRNPTETRWGNTYFEKSFHDSRLSVH